MLDINKFHLNKNNSNSYEVIKNLKVFIDNFVSSGELRNALIDISKLLNVDNYVLEKKTKKFISNQFSYKENKFINFSSIFNILKDYIIFIFILFKILFFSKNQETKLKTEIILFNVDYIDEIEKFKNVLKKFENSTIITNREIKFNKSSKYLSDEYLKKNLTAYYNNDKLVFSYKDKPQNFTFKTHLINKNKVPLISNCLKNKSDLFKFVSKYLLKSVKHKFNYVKILNLIIYSYVKNFSIFKLYKSSNLIQDRIYNTCSIRNYLFKKEGGKKCFCLQTHLAEGSINMFNDIDVLLSFADEQSTKNFMSEFGSRVDKIAPVGSLRCESYLNGSSQEFSEKKKIDILVIGVNLFNWLYVNHAQKTNYYKFIKLIKELSISEKKLNIYMKHHPNNIADKDEREILKNSNVKYINPKLNSYKFIENTKIFLSFSSTMIIEVYGAGRTGYFVDPDKNNNVFFEKNNSLRKIRLSDLEELKKVVSAKMNLDKGINNYNDICLKSDNVSNLIFKNLKSQII